jgi:hypothetical protein
MKKVHCKKLIGLSRPAFVALNRRIRITGRNQTDVLNDLLLSRECFCPLVEAVIARRQKQKHLCRDAAIESLLLEAVKRFQLA